MLTMNFAPVTLWVAWPNVKVICRTDPTEDANSVYGQLPLGASNSYTQWFAAAAT
jgi:hypothetical protein